MSTNGNNTSTRQRIDGIGCAGLLFLLVLMIFVGLNLFGDLRAENGEPAPADGKARTLASMGAPADDAVEETARPEATATQTATSTATAVSTHTPLPTATEPSTSTPLPTATATAVAALPPTASPTATALPPLPTPQGVYSWTLQVPILMYHYISIPPEDADKYRVDLSVAPEEFRAQMAYLAANGFEPIDLYDLSLAITAKRELPPKPVIITLDDGYRDNYENAFPILQEFGFKATFFVVTEFIDRGFADYVTWEMVKEMAAAGMRIEPHSKTHPDLSGQERDFVIYQILGAQETLAAHIGYTPRYFCYPGGRYDEQTIEVLQELDFWGAVTTANGKWHGFNNRYEWPRLRMRWTTTLPVFADFVEPGAAVSGELNP